MKNAIRVAALAVFFGIIAATPGNAGLKEWTAAVICGPYGAFSTAFIDWWKPGDREYILNDCVNYFYFGRAR